MHSETKGHLTTRKRIVVDVKTPEKEPSVHSTVPKPRRGSDPLLGLLVSFPHGSAHTGPEENVGKVSRHLREEFLLCVVTCIRIIIKDHKFWGLQLSRC